MIASKVVKESEVTDALNLLGFTKTNVRDPDETGTYWRSKSGRHLLVPDSVQGFYPDWLLHDLQDRLNRLSEPK